MEEKKKILQFIKITVNYYIPDSEVSLFGSRARTDADTDSDYDILVTTNITLSPKEKFPLKTSIRKKLLQSGIRTDILIQSKKDIAIKKNLPGHIIRNIIKDAVVL